MAQISPAFLKQLWLTFGASLAFLIVGLVRGYSSSAIPSIEDTDPYIITNTEQKSWIGAVPPLGAFFGSIGSGVLMQHAGRKRTLQLTAPLWLASWVILGLAKLFPLVLLGRALSGVCVGFALGTTQVYVSECCDPEIRGQLGSLPTLSMSLGIVLSYVAGTWLTWRFLAFFSSLFCAVLFIVLIRLPESPVWLKAKGKDPSQAVKWLRLSPRATAKDENEKDQNIPSLFSRNVFFSSVVIKPLIVVFGLLLLQQLSGIDTVIFFTVEIFKKAGSSLDAKKATIIIGVVQLISNVVSTCLVDRAGRRPLLLISSTVMFVSMAGMGASFYFESVNNSIWGYLPLVSLVLFMCGFSLGFGGVPFIMLGELFPEHYRSQLSAMASSLNLLSMFSVIKSYHSLENIMSPAGTFWLYTSFCILAFFFVLFLVPETKGKSLAEIEEHFRGKKKPKKNVEHYTCHL